MRKHPKPIILLLLGILILLHFSVPELLESALGKAFNSRTFTSLQSTYESSTSHQDKKDEIDLNNLDFQIDESIHVQVLFNVYDFKVFIINYKAAYHLDGNYSGLHHQYQAVINPTSQVKLKSSSRLDDLIYEHVENIKKKALLKVKEDFTKKINPSN